MIFVFEAIGLLKTFISNYIFLYVIFLDNVNTSNLLSTAQQVLTPPQPTAMPQLILASGQIIQGIQGAQLLIPTSQGFYRYYYLRNSFT